MMSEGFIEKIQSAARGGPSTKRLLAFLSKDAPVDSLAKAQRASDWMERAAIARNINTPMAVVRKLADDGNAVVRAIARSRL
jgi:hypothetical protein